MVTQWQNFQTELFSCRLPPGWTLEPADKEKAPGRLLMHDAERSIALVFTSLPEAMKDGTSNPASLPTEYARLQLHRWVERLTHVRLYESLHPVPSQGQVICTTEGLELLRAGVPWWRRLLRLGPRMLWRFWAILGGDVLVLASCNGKPDAIERHRETVNKIIQSVHLPREAAHDYLMGMKAPHTSDHVLRWSEVRPQVLPLLIPTHRLSQYGEKLIQQPWVNELSIIYVTPEPQRALTAADCERWNVDVETLHNQSLHNLVGRSQELTMEGGRADGYTMLAFAQPDPFNAIRILLPDLQHKLREYLGPTFYVAIPNRTFLLAFATQDEEILERVRQQIRTDYSKLPNPISAKLFIMTADGVAGDDGDGAGAEDF